MTSVKFTERFARYQHVRQPTLLSKPNAPTQTIFQPFTTKLVVNTNHRCFTCQGLSPQTLQHFEAGYYPYDQGFLTRCLVVRLHDIEGNPVGYAGSRGASGACARWGKWQMPPALPRPRLIYNWHRASLHNHLPLIITEGPWAIMKLYQAGFKNAVALFEPPMTTWNFRLITTSPAPRICLLLPGDDPGGRAAQRIQELLGSRARKVFLPHDVEIDDLSEYDLRELLDPYCE